MHYLLMRLQNDEELLRRITQDGTRPLMGTIPEGRAPAPLKAKRQPSPKPRARPHRPVADALAAWRAYVARHA